MTVTRYTFADMQAYAAEHDGFCLSTSYVNARTNLRWKCAKGHIWNAPGPIVGRGSWCKKCACVANGRSRMTRTLESLQEIARKKGGECLATEYTSAAQKMRWRCGKGHEWIAAAGDVGRARRSTWCPKCANDVLAARNRRFVLADLIREAEARGGACLAVEYHLTHDYLQWRCREGHVWTASATRVMAGGWCPKCAQVANGAACRRYTLADMQTIALERGGQCLSEAYAIVTDKLRWKCAKGHTFESTASNVLRGQWCGRCAHLKARLSRTRRIAGTVARPARATSASRETTEVRL